MLRRGGGLAAKEDIGIIDALRERFTWTLNSDVGVEYKNK